jgi:DNA-binding NarL/FixJ family response regulator
VIKVAILDSSPIYLYGLLQVLDAEKTIQVLAAQIAPADQFDSLVDVSLVDPNALDANRVDAYVAALSRIHRVLLWSTRGGSVSSQSVLRVGASGILDRNDSPARVIAAIRCVAANKTWTDPRDPLPVEMTIRNAVTKPLPTLSEREEQVLRQISSGLTHGQIATRMGISPHTVDTYVKRIRSKLGVGNKADLTRAALLGPLYPSSAA